MIHKKEWESITLSSPDTNECAKKHSTSQFSILLAFAWGGGREESNFNWDTVGVCVCVGGCVFVREFLCLCSVYLCVSCGEGAYTHV